jgi:glycerol-3-phosphate cytidylyltransferase
MKYCFDIDGTLCTTDASHDYALAKPLVEIIDSVNSLYEQGHHITLFTARGASSKIDWHDLTVKQLSDWNVKYHTLIDKHKPSYDLFIDDKAISADEWKRRISKKIVGFLAGSFDVVHPGYVAMFQQAKNHCDKLIVGLHADSTLENPNKIKPILSVDDRRNTLLALKYVDEVIVYHTENELVNLVDQVKPHIRFLGDDYKNKVITGCRDDVKIHFLDRSHGWSTTKFKNLIKKSLE